MLVETIIGRLAVVAVMGLSIAGCEEDKAAELERTSRIEERVTRLENRLELLEGAVEKPVDNIPQEPPEPLPQAFLAIGNNDRQPFASMQRCEEARRSVLAQYDQQCRDSGAAFCGNPRVLCIPS